MRIRAAGILTIMIITALLLGGCSFGSRLRTIRDPQNQAETLITPTDESEENVSTEEPVAMDIEIILDGATSITEDNTTGEFPEIIEEPVLDLPEWDLQLYEMEEVLSALK